MLLGATDRKLGLLQAAAGCMADPRSLLPIGILQFNASVTYGLWYARSEAFMQQDILQTLRWVRTFGDVVFITGAVAMALQVVLGLLGKKPALATPEVGLSMARS